MHKTYMFIVYGLYTYLVVFFKNMTFYIVKIVLKILGWTPSSLSTYRFTIFVYKQLIIFVRTEIAYFFKIN